MYYNNTTSCGTYTFRVYKNRNSTTYNNWYGMDYQPLKPDYKERRNRDLTGLLHRDYERKIIEKMKTAL